MGAKPFGIIYKITNTANGKVYVGQTTRALAWRWRCHRYNASGCRRLKSAILKYGADAFSIEQVALGHSRDELNQLESEWIQKLDSIHPRGYNLMLGGAATHSKDTRSKLAASLKRYYAENAEARAKNSAAVKRWFASAEGQAQHSAAQKRRFANPQERAQDSARAKARFQNPEFHAKHAEAQKLRFENPEERAAQLARLKLIHESSEARARNSASLKRYFEDPAARAKNSAAIKRHFANPEARATHAANQKRVLGSPEVRAKMRAGWRKKRTIALLERQIAQLNWP